MKYFHSNFSSNKYICQYKLPDINPRGWNSTLCIKNTCTMQQGWGPLRLSVELLTFFSYWRRQDPLLTSHSMWKDESISSKIWNKTGMSILTPFIQHSSGSPSHGSQRRKRNKRNLNWKRRCKIHWLQMTWYYT